MKRGGIAAVRSESLEGSYAAIPRAELLHASREEIALAVEHAEPMVLRGLLYQLTGDEAVAATEIEIDPTGFQTSMKVTHDDDVALLRNKAIEFLDTYRASGAGPLDIGPEERLPGA